MTVETTGPSSEEKAHGVRRWARRGDLNTRGRGHWFWDLIFKSIRAIGGHARNFHATFGIFLLVGGLVALAGTFAFARFASHVSSGRTQAFDESVLRWVADHKSPALEPVVLEITFLGTGSVVMMIVAVSALFLWLTTHKYSSILLLIATFGGIILNNLLKMGFGRPRPQLFDWGTHVVSYSFPSGHAMSAAVVYGTVAYLAARLQKRHWHRVATMLAALLLIILICLSRLYLGVHYPSDVIAGVLIGLTWAAFCMATLEAIQLYGRRRAPKVLEHEQPPPREPAPVTAG
jgi:undecaprenyl-diphosphatase